MKRNLAHKLIAGVITGIAAAVIVWLLANLILPGLFSSFEARTYDHRVTLDIQDVPRQSIDDIVIIDIDGFHEVDVAVAVDVTGQRRFEVRRRQSQQADCQGRQDPAKSWEHARASKSGMTRAYMGSGSAARAEGTDLRSVPGRINRPAAFAP